MVSTNSLESVDVLEVPNKDKLVHFTFYYVFTVSWYMYFRNKYRNRARGLVFLLAIAYGGLIELCQLLFTSGRSADVLDELANAIGSAAAVLTIWLIGKVKN